MESILSNPHLCIHCLLLFFQSLSAFRYPSTHMAFVNHRNLRQHQDLPLPKWSSKWGQKLPPPKRLTKRQIDKAKFWSNSICFNNCKCFASFFSLSVERSYKIKHNYLRSEEKKSNIFPWTYQISTNLFS